MHIYHVASGTPVAAILRPARTPKGTEVRTVIKHVTKRARPGVKRRCRNDQIPGHKVDKLDKTSAFSVQIRQTGRFTSPRELPLHLATYRSQFGVSYAHLGRRTGASPHTIPPLPHDS
jgi:hypothetical protein